MKKVSICKAVTIWDLHFMNDYVETRRMILIVLLALGCVLLLPLLAAIA